MRQIGKISKMVRIWSHCQEEASLLNLKGPDRSSRHSNIGSDFKGHIFAFNHLLTNFSNFLSFQVSMDHGLFDLI